MGGATTVAATPFLPMPMDSFPSAASHYSWASAGSLPLSSVAAFPAPQSVQGPRALFTSVGLLTPLSGPPEDRLLPLMGRSVSSSRSTWNYYTESNTHRSLRLPVRVQGKDALSDQGVPELSDGDTVYVEGYNDAFRVTLYTVDRHPYRF
jgi:hypothetical protein